MDNTCRENKCRNVVGLCQFLVGAGLCDEIVLSFLPVGHTHERVDQIFSRISWRLAKLHAYTLENFLHIVKDSYHPHPNVSELLFTLDFSKWLSPFFQSRIEGMTRDGANGLSPHRFHFTRSTDTASGTQVQTALWSDSPLTNPVDIFKSFPDGVPEIRAGRPVFHRWNDSANTDRFSSDWQELKKQMNKIFDDWEFLQHEIDSWTKVLKEIEDAQSLPAEPYVGFWPKSRADVDAYLAREENVALVSYTECGRVAPSTEELDRRATEVEEEIRRNESTFRGLHAGPSARLTERSTNENAAWKNFVIVDHSAGTSEAHVGEWESQFVVGYVKTNKGMDLQVQLYEPWVQDENGCPTMPLWLSDELKAREDIDYEPSTDWETVLSLPWKQVKAVPYRIAEAMFLEENPGGSFEPPLSRVKHTFMDHEVKVYKYLSSKGYCTETFSRENVLFVVQSHPHERPGHDGVLRFDDESRPKLASLVEHLEVPL